MTAANTVSAAGHRTWTSPETVRVPATVLGVDFDAARPASARTWRWSGSVHMEDKWGTGTAGAARRRIMALVRMCGLSLPAVCAISCGPYRSLCSLHARCTVVFALRATSVQLLYERTEVRSHARRHRPPALSLMHDMPQPLVKSDRATTFPVISDADGSDFENSGAGQRAKVPPHGAGGIGNEQADNAVQSIIQTGGKVSPAETQKGNKRNGAQEDFRDSVQMGVESVPWGGDAQTLKLRNARSGVLIAVLAALAVNLGKVCQKRGTQDLPVLQFKPSVLRSYVSNGWWLVGVVLDISGALMTMVSLSLAPVSVVQPVLGCGLAFVALFSVIRKSRS